MKRGKLIYECGGKNWCGFIYYNEDNEKPYLLIIKQNGKILSTLRGSEFESLKTSIKLRELALG